MIHLLSLFLLLTSNVYSKEISLAKIKCDNNLEANITENKNQSSSKSQFNIKKSAIKAQKKYIKKLAKKNHISKETIALIDKLNINHTIVRLERFQPETKITLQEYLAKVIPQYKINNAKQYLKDNWQELELVEKKYKVDKEIIVSIILIESYLGKVMGNFNVLDALFTLSTVLKKTQFWTGELLNALFLVDQKNTIYSKDLKGSWAGAIGMIQFIPSSFIAYGVDGSGDGKVDIINNKLDAFASVANYLKKSGWKYKKKYLKTTETPKTFAEICSKAGSEFKGGILIIPDKKLDTPSFIVYNNFKVILLWNKSLFFSTAVGTVFNELKNETQNI
jgi:membrane-bound lytic murein transglycosylase B